MTYIFLGIAAFFFVSSVVAKIIGIVKKIPSIEKIASPFIPSSIILAFVFLIKNFLPDSRFLLINGTLSISLVLISEIMFIFKRKRIFYIAGNVSFILGILSALFITNPSFKLYDFPPFFAFFTYSVYIALILVLFFTFIKTKTPLVSTFYFAKMISSAIYSYSTLITLFGDARLYSTILFSGSIFLMAEVFFNSKNESKITSSTQELFPFIFLTIFLVSFASGIVLMQAL